MSLRWRIMGSIVFVIVLTVLISVGVGYYTTQYRLGTFVDEIGDDQASRLARNLSRAYTSAGGWVSERWTDRCLSPDTSTTEFPGRSMPKRAKENPPSSSTGTRYGSSLSTSMDGW